MKISFLLLQNGEELNMAWVSKSGIIRRGSVWINRIFFVCMQSMQCRWAVMICAIFVIVLLEKCTGNETGVVNQTETEHSKIKYLVKSPSELAKPMEKQNFKRLQFQVSCWGLKTKNDMETLDILSQRNCPDFYYRLSHVKVNRGSIDCNRISYLD